MRKRRVLLTFGRPGWVNLLTKMGFSVETLKHEFSLLNFGGGASLKPLWKIAKESRGKYDLIFGDGVDGFLWHLVFRLAGNPTPFAIVPAYNLALPPWNALMVFLSSLAAASGRNVVFSASRCASYPYEKLGFKCAPLPSFPFGVDLSLFRRLEEREIATLRRRRGFKPSDKVLLYTGRLSEDKNVFELIEAFCLVIKEFPPPRRLHLIIGYGAEGAEPSYESACRTLATRAAGRVKFIRGLSGRRLVEIYNSADIFVSAAVSLYEAAGRSPLEAAACGLPVVLPAWDGFKENFGRGGGVLVPLRQERGIYAPDVSSLAAALLSLLQEESRRQKLAEQGMKMVEKFDARHGPEMVLAQLEKLWRQPRKLSERKLTPLTVNLKNYLRPVRQLFASLNGRRVDKLLSQYLETNILPFSYSDKDYRKFMDFWFTKF